MLATKSKERINTYLDPVLIKRIKAQAIVEGKTISEIIANALNKHLPSSIKIEFKMINKPKTGQGLSIQYDNKELDFLVSRALSESKQGKTIVINNTKKLEASIKDMKKEAKSKK